MSRPASLDTIDVYYQRLAGRDQAGLMELLADDVSVRYYGPPGLLPWIGEFSGREGFQAFFGIIAEHLDIVEVERLATIADEHKVVIQCRGCWRRKATGADIHGDMVNVFTVADERITRYEVYNDTAAFAAAFAD